VDVNTSLATANEDFGAGGFQVVLVYFQFHCCFILLRVWGFWFLVKKLKFVTQISDFIESQKSNFRTWVNCSLENRITQISVCYMKWMLLFCVAAVVLFENNIHSFNPKIKSFMPQIFDFPLWVWRKTPSNTSSSFPPSFLAWDCCCCWLGDDLKYFHQK
jgi:hypothetical protein